MVNPFERLPAICRTLLGRVSRKSTRTPTAGSGTRGQSHGRAREHRSRNRPLTANFSSRHSLNHLVNSCPVYGDPVSEERPRYRVLLALEDMTRSPKQVRGDETSVTHYRKERQVCTDCWETSPRDCRRETGAVHHLQGVSAGISLLVSIHFDTGVGPPPITPERSPLSRGVVHCRT
jgi:hypothetical protein